MKRLSKFAMCLALCLNCGGPQSLAAAKQVDSKRVAKDGFEVEGAQGQAGPYCGVASLYIALRALGLTIDYADLLYPRYVGTADGSSSAELIRAAEDFGAAAVAYTGLNGGLLRSTKNPIILHVSDRSGIQPNNFNHWVVLLGNENGKARVWELGSGTELVEFPWLLSRSDGIGVIVSSTPVSRLGVIWSNRYSIAVTLSACAALLFCSLYPIRRPSNRVQAGAWRSDLRAVAILASLSIAIGGFWNAANADGLLNHWPVLQQLGANHFGHPISRIRVADLQRGDRGEQPVFVDARPPTSQREGAIPGAISVNPNAGPWIIADVMSSVDKESLVVVYCQSENCGFADTIGRHLLSAGFSNVRVLDGGWVKWRESEEPTSP